jgi:membrane-bound acyltransferase YfiQ involved in biofilm formation
MYQYTVTSSLMTVTDLFSHIPHCMDGCPVKVVLIPSGLYEQMSLDVSFHLLHAGHKMIVTPVHFSRAGLASGMWDASSELVREFVDQFIVDVFL